MSSSPTALVTGSTRGIGRAIAFRLARDGYAVVVNHAGPGGGEETAAAIRGQGGEAVAIRADVRWPDECRRLVREAEGLSGPVAALVNNVGPFLERPLQETTDEEWRLLVDGNLSSAFYCAREVLPAMRRRGGGSIVNVGALNAEISPGMSHEAPAYFVAKTALLMLTRTLARSEGRHGIRVNAVNPGFVETEAYADWSEAEQTRWRERIPLGRFGRPDEIAEAVSYLVSERAAYVSGAILAVHGGLWL